MSQYKLSTRQVELLKELDSALRRNPAGTRISPMMLGGRDGSHHSSTLASLCKKGLVDRKKGGWRCWCKCGEDAMFGHRCKGSFTYSLTETGKQKLETL